MDELFEQAVKNFFNDWYPSVNYSIDPFTKNILVFTDNEQVKIDIAVKLNDLVELFNMQTME